MNRREFLTRTKKRPAVNMIASRSLASGLNTYEGPWTNNEVMHLLKRTMFGARKADVDHFAGLSLNDAVDELLNTIRTITPPIREYGLIEDADSMYEDPTVAIGQTWINDMNTAVTVPSVRTAINLLRIKSLRSWWAGLMLNQQRSIEEKMVLFWHHHFSVQKEEVENCNYLYRHHELLRNNVLGNVRELTKKVTIDAAMLMHLNGYLNSKRAPDENYARELQELFTVGKGNDSLYTESDVREAARVLTGWRINSQTQIPYLDPDNHDTGSKTFSSFYNNTTISGSTDGKAEIDQLINMIFATTECARFICRKLYKWFVYYQIDEETEANIITPLAELLRNSNFEIKPVLSALLKSEHFFDSANQACYIKSPYDFIAGTLREFNVGYPDYTDHVNGYPFFHNVYQRAADMQQDLFQPPDVSGWPAYYQEPMLHEIWVNSNSLPKRASFTDRLISDNILDLNAFVAQTSNPSDPDQVINEVTALLLRYPLTANSKKYIKDNFDTKNMFRFILNLPEYHLC